MFRCSRTKKSHKGLWADERGRSVQRIPERDPDRSLSPRSFPVRCISSTAVACDFMTWDGSPIETYIYPNEVASDVEVEQTVTIMSSA